MGSPSVSGGWLYRASAIPPPKDAHTTRRSLIEMSPSSSPSLSSLATVAIAIVFVLRRHSLAVSVYPGPAVAGRSVGRS